MNNGPTLINQVLINRNTLTGISEPFDVNQQLTVYAYNLVGTQRVSFEIVALSELVKSACGNCPPAVQLPAVVDAMQLKCCGDPILLTRDQPWVIIDVPQGSKIRARLENDMGVNVVPDDQLVVYNTTNVPNVNDRMRGCACAGA